MTLTEAQRKALRKGRKIGAPLGGRAVMEKPAPTSCRHCRLMGYTRWAQHLGHLGFAATMRRSPTALHSVEEKIRQANKENGWRRPQMGRPATWNGE